MSSIDEVAKHFKNIILKARVEILAFKKYEIGIEALLQVEAEIKRHSSVFLESLTFLYQTLALAYFEHRNYDLAANIYYQTGELYQAGFCELLSGSPEKSFELWNKLPDSEPVQWAKSLLTMIDNTISSPKLPSFIQIRNHLEADLSYIIQADRIEYAENLINCSDLLVQINPEAYKFIGKALMTNGFNSIAADFLLKSQQTIPNDPEIYYFLGQYSYDIGSIEESITMFEECLRINSSYSPARLMIEKLQNRTIIAHN
jgi:tetratricopeptide (TPR) repeat protein